MTVRLASKIYRYIGLSGDDKPQPGRLSPDGKRELTDADVPTGCTFLEADTEEIWRWNGNEWRQADTPEVRELKAIKSLLAIMVEQSARAF